MSAQIAPASDNTLEFLSILLRSARSVDECWEWTGARFANGYGRFSGHAAHRKVHEMFVGPLHDGQVVRHHCDNPPCINPKHLAAGTHWDNSQDRVLRNRQITGESINTVRLTAGEVQEVRRLYALGGITQKELAYQFGVDQTTISCIVRRQSWAWLEDAS